MLSATQVFVGALADVTELTLLLPRSRYEQAAIIAPSDNKLFMIFLGPQHQFQAFECSGNTHWKGLLVPGIGIEVDEATVFDPKADGASLGAMVRSDTRLSLAADGEVNFGRARTLVPLVADLIACGDGQAAGFSKWQVTVGTGLDKQILHTMDLSDCTKPAVAGDL